MRTVTTVVLSLAVAALLVGCSPDEPEVQALAETPETTPQEAEPMGPGVTLQYFGHACFTATDSGGTRVAIDPYDDSLGYEVPALSADVCLVTHDHFDHSNTGAVAGPPEIVRTEGATEASGIAFAGVTASHHAPGENEERGDIVMFRWEMDGIALAHLGDLGMELSPEQAEALKPVDVLLVPVGGYYTIDAQQAINTIQALSPRVVVPMHYRTDAGAEKLGVLATVDDFLALVPSSWMTSRSDVNIVNIQADDVQDESAPLKVYVMNYE